MPRIIILDPVGADRLTRMEGYLPEGFTIEGAASRSEQDQLAAMKAADFVIVSDVPVTAAMLEAGAASGLKAVQKWGVGYDAIDLEAARRVGVRVMRTTGSNAVAVAETTLGMILAMQRNLVRGHMGVTAGEWPKSELAPTSMKLSGKTVGIIGLGYVGKALVKLLQGFGCTVLYTKRSPLPAEEEAALDVRFVTLEELLAQSDVVTLNCELNDQTRGLMNAKTLAQMKEGSLLVNLARGGVVVEADLAAAVRNGPLRGAAVDVFAQEPVEAGNPLVGQDRIIVTPHVGAISADSFPASVTRMIGNIACVHRGEEPPEIDVLV
ncbi:2-hydroxyacid dehydrogenase [Falsirhodobacter sp. alg1]|uniref:2-hydroxyacid dehydrogenase n=1 Tax=Falsirhodobacter sp. alg1 TaxID=1472418 RepID=UPI00082E7430|nr:2-hydroxyacid dehydrogenase [Falsirhodobacter sp. alg1]